MKSKFGKKAALVLAGLLLMQTMSIHVMQAEMVEEATVLASETETGVGSVSQAEPEVKPEPAPQAEPEVKPEPAPQAEPEVKPEPAPQAEPEVRPEPAPQVEPEVKPEPAPQAGQEVNPEHAPQAEPGTPVPGGGGAEAGKAEGDSEDADAQGAANDQDAAGGAEANSGETAGRNASEEAAGESAEKPGETAGGESSADTGTEGSGDDLPEVGTSEASTEISPECSEGEPWEKAEEVEETSTETAEEKGGDPSLTEIALQQDGNGAYYTYTSDHNTSLTLTLNDGGGSQVGQSKIVSPATVESVRVYFLSQDSNDFSLTEADYGKTVALTIKVVNDEGETTDQAVGTITLTPPSLTLPSSVNCSVLSKTEDLYDINVVSGISWTNGSCRTSKVVEKLSGGSWTEVPNGRAFTSADTGVYRVRIKTSPNMGTFYSNEVTVAVPITDFVFGEDPAIGSKITVKPVGPDGTEAQVQNFAWYYGDGTAAQGSELTFTPQLKDALQAQTMTLRLTAKDLIGNTFTKYVTLKPLDLSKASLSFGDYGHPDYDGDNQMPDAALFLDDYEIPKGLYTAEPAADKNSVNAGEAWAKVTGEGTYLTGTAYVQFVIDPIEMDIDEDDFITSFDYDGSEHMPVLKGSASKVFKLKYKKWRKKNADGSWTKITGAPVESGTYRVNVTVTGADGNYEKAVFKKMVFTINGSSEPESQQPEPQQPKTQSTPMDLTVTDADGNAAGYRSRDISLAGEGQEEAKPALEISADPVKRSDGNVQLDENGKSVYRQRNLHVTPTFMKNMQTRQAMVVRFVLEDAAVQLNVSALDTAAAYTVKLAPLDDKDLTEEEKVVLAGYKTGPGIYAVRVVREDTGADVTEAVVSSGALEVMLDVTQNDGSTPAGILFLKEDRARSSGAPIPYTADGQLVRQEDREYLKRTAPGSGIFTLLRE